MTKRHELLDFAARAARASARPLASVVLALALFAALAVAAPAQAADLETLNHQQIVALARKNASEGKATLINFWATWCGPCVMEIPDLVKLRADYPEKKLAMMGVSLDVDRRDVVRFMERKPMNYPVYMAADDVPSVFGIQAIPKMILYGPKGDKLKEIEGLVEPKTLRALIDAALGK